MKRAHRLVVAVAALLLPAVAGRAQSGSEATLSGAAQLGFRLVDVGGRAEKYREDVNLEEGPRLFRFDLDFTPPASLRDAVDKVEIDFQNFGGDPFETLHASVKKHGRYTLKYDRHKSNYFYDDIILPPQLSSVSLSNGGDFHGFDFDRVRDSASLALHLSKAARFDFGFDRFTKKGGSTTTLDIQRDEFELDQPVDESMNEYRGSFEYTTRPLTLVFEERVRTYDNAVEIFLPGGSPGENEENPTTLDFYRLERPYDFTGFTHLARALAHPNEKLTIQAAASLNTLDLDVSLSEEGQGTDFQGRPFSTDLAGSGKVKRDMGLVDLDLTYLVSARVALLGAFRRHELNQEGDLAYAPAGSSAFDIGMTTAEAGLRLIASPQLTLGGGARYATRDVTSTWSSVPRTGGIEGDTRNTGLFLSLGWRPSRRVRITAGYEGGTYEGPFTATSPTGQHLFRLRGQYGGGEGFSLSGSYRGSRGRSDDSGWRGDSDILNLRLGFRRASFSTSLGYSWVSLERSIEQTVTTLPGVGGGAQFLVPIAYDVDTNAFDGRVIWSFIQGWRLGGQVRLYDSRGSFALNRNDLRAWLEAELGRHYVAHLGLRALDYEQTLQGFNDYDARIVEASIGYRW